MLTHDTINANLPALIEVLAKDYQSVSWTIEQHGPICGTHASRTFRIDIWYKSGKMNKTSHMTALINVWGNLCQDEHTIPDSAIPIFENWIAKMLE